MWEDESGWNAYNDQTNDGGGNDWSNWSNSGQDWANDASVWEGQHDWSNTPLQGGYQQPYQPPQSGGTPSWQQEYDYSPKYQPGAVSNPYAAQITSGNPGPEAMYQRMGGTPEGAMQGFHFYRNQPGYQNDPALVEGEHYATSKYNLSSPLNATGLPQAFTAMGPPSYDALKWMAQNAPEWLRQYMPQFLTHASPPTLNSTWAGVKPLFNMPFGR